MKLFAVLLLALPLLGTSSPAEDLGTEVKEPRPHSGHESPEAVADEEYEHEVGDTEADEDGQKSKTSITPSPHSLKNADDEAAKERRRLVNMRKRFNLPLYQRHKNETSGSLTSEKSETGEKDKSVVSKDAEPQVNEDAGEDATGGDGEKPKPNRPRRRFGGRHQADESESQSTPNIEDSGTQDNPPSEANDRPYRRRGLGRLSEAHEADESKSELVSDNEDDKIQDGIAPDVNEGSDQPRRLGGYGRRHKAAESESESIPDNESEVPGESDHSVRSTSAAPTRGLAGLLNARYRSSRTQIGQDGGTEEADSPRGASHDEEEYDVESTDDQETARQSTRNTPGHERLRSQYQDEEPATVDDTEEQANRWSLDKEKNKSDVTGGVRKPLRSRFQQRVEDEDKVVEDDEHYIPPSR